MKEYRIGTTYSFKIIGIQGRRIFLEDENGDKFSVPAYDFQADWDYSSPKVPCHELKCYIKGMTEKTLMLEQDKYSILELLYPEAARKEPKVNSFIIDSLKTINDELYYILIDVFGIHHFYKPTKSSLNTSLQPGDEIELMVNEIKEKNRNKSLLIFSEKKEFPSFENCVINTIGEFGEESDIKEFKSTIVYPAGATTADIDTQIQVILKTIAGFMNAKGGTLFIGVNDNGEPVGIEHEYHLLNTSLNDRYTYKEQKDGYENKLRSSMNRMLGPVAQDYVSIKFSEHKGHTICTIDIKPSNNVIWFKESEAYKRMGNRTSHLRSTAIEKLILDKQELLRPSSKIISPLPVTNEDELILQDTPDYIDEKYHNKVEPQKIKKIGGKRNGRGSFYINIFTNGEWSWSKKQLFDNNLEFCVPINSPSSKKNLIMVYSDGCVNRVDIFGLHKKKKENQHYKDGRRKDDVILLKVFEARKDDLLACFCHHHTNRYVKVHTVEHVGLHKDLASKGNIIINTKWDGVTMDDICFVSSEHRARISSLEDIKKTENQKSSSLGRNIDLPENAKYQQTIATLKALCDIPSQLIDK